MAKNRRPQKQKPHRVTREDFDLRTLAYTPEQRERALVTATRARTLNPSGKTYKRKPKHQEW